MRIHLLIFRSLASGSSGNAYLLKTDHVSLLFEAGVRLPTLAYYLGCEDVDPRSLEALFISHEHFDHCSGARDLASEFGTTIFANHDVLKAAALENLPSAEQIDVDLPVEIGDVRVECFAVDHDSVSPLGFLIRVQDRVIVIATDLGSPNDAVERAVAQADLVVLEANHDTRMLHGGGYPYALKQRVSGSKGHLSNAQAGHLLARHLQDDTVEVWLGHLSKENNTHSLALKTVGSFLAAAGRSQTIRIASRDRPSARWSGQPRPRQLSLFARAEPNGGPTPTTAFSPHPAQAFS